MCCIGCGSTRRLGSLPSLLKPAAQQWRAALLAVRSGQRLPSRGEITGSLVDSAASARRVASHSDASTELYSGGLFRSDT